MSSPSGKLVKVTGAPNQSEGEIIRGLLSEYGIPSMLKNAAGATPYGDFFPCQVFVPEELAEQAREVLEAQPDTD